jgi:hypothetical protein
MEKLDAINLLFSGGGAVIGALAVVIFTTIRDWGRGKLNIGVREAILEVKREFLDDLKQKIMEAQDAVTKASMAQDTIHAIQKQAQEDVDKIRLRTQEDVDKIRLRTQEDADKIRLHSEQVKDLVEKLAGQNQTLSSKEVASILKPEIISIVKPEIISIVKAWLPIRFQMGQAELEGKLGKKVGRPEKRTTFVKFPTSFDKIPEVYVSLVKVDLSGGSIHRIKIEAIDVNKDGFGLVFETWSDSVVYTARAAWLAIENDKREIAM